VDVSAVRGVVRTRTRIADDDESFVGKRMVSMI